MGATGAAEHPTMRRAIPPPPAPSGPTATVRGVRSRVFEEEPVQEPSLTPRSAGHPAAASISLTRAWSFTLPQTRPQALTAGRVSSGAGGRCAAAQSLSGARAHSHQPATPSALKLCYARRALHHFRDNPPRAPPPARP